MITLNLNPRTLPEARTELQTAHTEIERLEGDLTAAKDAVPEVKEAPEFKALQTNLETAQRERGEFETRVNDLTPKLETAQRERGEFETRVNDLTPKLAAAEEKVGKLPEMAKNKAIELLAAKGLSPMKLGLMDEQGERPDNTGLKGTAKVAAAFKQELAATES